jgi:two-component system CheB/CheR fusion protein
MRDREGTNGTLLIALTGWGQAQDKKRAAEAGFDEHVTKPVETELLRAMMAAIDNTELEKTTYRQEWTRLPSNKAGTFKAQA